MRCLALAFAVLAAAAPAAAGFVAATPVERVDYWQQRQADIERTLAAAGRPRACLWRMA